MKEGRIIHNGPAADIDDLEAFTSGPLERRGPMLDLYRFELKKILTQKLLWILAAAILLGLAVFGVATEVRPHQQRPAHGRSHRSAAGGQPGTGRPNGGPGLSGPVAPLFTDPEANTEAQLKYNDFFNWLTLILGTAHRQEILQTDEARLYEALWHQLAPDPQAAGLTQEEIAHWTEQAQARLAQPLVYQGYHEGWQTTARGIEVMVFLEILFLAVVLAPLFPQEHLRRTDQLILSCRFGRGKAYAAKLLAGVTVGWGSPPCLLCWPTWGCWAWSTGWRGRMCPPCSPICSRQTSPSGKW